MKHLITALLVSILFFSASCSQSDSKGKKEDQVSKTESKITATAKTDRHVKIPGSHLYIIPPAGFSEDKSTGEIKKEYSNFIMMRIISGYTPEKFFSELKAQADKDAPGSWKQENIIADGHKASIYKYGAIGVIQYYLAFTDGYTDEMIVVNFEDTELPTGQAMYEALKTVIAER